MISESFCYSRVLRTTASENPNLVNQASHQTNRAITQRSDGENGGLPASRGERKRQRTQRPAEHGPTREAAGGDRPTDSPGGHGHPRHKAETKQTTTTTTTQHNSTGGQQVHAKGATIRYDSWQRLIMSRVQTFTKNTLQRITLWETSKNAIGLKMQQKVVNEKSFQSNEKRAPPARGFTIYHFYCIC